MLKTGGEKLRHLDGRRRGPTSAQNTRPGDPFRTKQKKRQKGAKHSLGKKPNLTDVEFVLFLSETPPDGRALQSRRDTLKLFPSEDRPRWICSGGLAIHGLGCFLDLAGFTVCRPQRFGGLQLLSPPPFKKKKNKGRKLVWSKTQTRGLKHEAASHTVRSRP